MQIIEQKAINLAQSLGSGAKTARGASHFLADCSRQVIVRRVRAGLVASPYWDDCIRTTRTADPEAKRARTDKVFRRKYLARLRRAEKRLVRCGADLDSAIEYAKNADEARAEWVEIQRLRFIVTGAARKPFPANHNGSLIPPCADTARQAGAKLVMRGRDASVRPCREASHHVHVDGATEWRNGRPRNYTRATNDNYVRSLAVIVSDSVVDYVLHESRYSVTLPDGQHWALDEMRRLVAVSGACSLDDFHPTAADMVAGGEHIAQELNDNRERRHQMSAEAAAEAADLASIYVCLADSLRAGNCPQGTRDFADRHELDHARHYTASGLLTITNGEAGRVRLAIKAATIRHNREMEAGRCVLADH